MLPTPSPEERVAKHKDFLSANWRRIGAFAYSEYLLKGRGIVCVPEEDFIHAPSPSYAPIHFRYFTEADIIEVMLDYDGSKEQGWVRSYSPDEKAIITILRYDAGVSSYLAGGQPSPPACHAAKVAEGN